jgi:FMN-dependent NADH-azoreductase
MLLSYFSLFIIYSSNRLMESLNNGGAMKTILQLNSSILAAQSQSSRLADEVVAALSEDGADVVRRDLAQNPLPHLDGERFGAFLSKDPSEKEQEILSLSNALVDELRRADVIVLGLPMYNFGVPSQLKAYFDHIARAGVTFRYTEKGAVGLLTGKKAYIIAARGGLYAGTPADTQTAYVRDFLAFLGITDVEFIYAEGLAMGDASKAAGLLKARDLIGKLVDRQVPAYA